MATVQLRNQTEGRAYYDRRKADGKTWMEAMRALKRRLSNIVTGPCSTTRSRPPLKTQGRAPRADPRAVTGRALVAHVRAVVARTAAT